MVVIKANLLPAGFESTVTALPAKLDKLRLPSQADQMFHKTLSILLARCIVVGGSGRNLSVSG